MALNYARGPRARHARHRTESVHVSRVTPRQRISERYNNPAVWACNLPDPMLLRSEGLVGRQVPCYI
jgi:hypothetical protein